MDQILPDQEMFLIFQSIINGNYVYKNINADVLFLCLLDTKSLKYFFEQEKIDLLEVKKELLESLEESNLKIKSQKEEVNQTPIFLKILEDTIEYVKNEKRNLFTPLDVLLNIVKHVENKEQYVFMGKTIEIVKKTNLTKEKIVKFKTILANSEILLEKKIKNNAKNDESSELTSTIISEMGKEKRVAIGQEEIVENFAKVFLRKNKKNILLVGGSGVGKTNFLESLAYSVKSSNVIYPSLQETVYFLLDPVQITAGSVHRGDVERKFSEMEREISTIANSVLVIDELSFFINIGAGGQADPFSLLIPFMNKQIAPVVATITPEKLATLSEKVPFLINLFHIIEIKEPSNTETFNILKYFAQDYQEYYKIKVSETVLEKIITLCEKYLRFSKFPQKALDLLEDSIAQKIINNLKITQTEKGLYVNDLYVNDLCVDDIKNVLAVKAKISKKHLNLNPKEELDSLVLNFSENIFGQDEAVLELIKIFKRFKTGLTKHGNLKPLGSFLFVGPTGVGKTEVAKLLASSLSIPLIRFDMSEFSEQHSVSKLLGSPPGYIGFQQQSEISKALSESGSCIFLFDEFEKAHQVIYNLFLQILDHGTITDYSGKKIDFRQSIIIFTSNVGSRSANKNSIGFNLNNDYGLEQQKDDITDFYSTEFRNRVDKIINFNFLNNDHYIKIIKLNIKKIAEDLKRIHSIEFFCTDLVEGFLLEKNIKENHKLGARPLLKIIDEEIVEKLSEFIIETKKNQYIILDIEEVVNDLDLGQNNLKNKKLIVKNVSKKMFFEYMQKNKKVLIELDYKTETCKKDFDNKIENKILNKNVLLDLNDLGTQTQKE